MGICGNPTNQLPRSNTYKKRDMKRAYTKETNMEDIKNKPRNSKEKDESDIKRTYTEQIGGKTIKNKARSSKGLVTNTGKKEKNKEGKKSLIKKEETDKETKNLENSVYKHQNTRGISILPEESVAFPKGERYYTLKKDSNISKEINSSLSEKIQLFFSLAKVCNPNDEHSFAIIIINNKKIGTKTFLGNLQNATGNEIEFGDSFIIGFFF